PQARDVLELLEDHRRCQVMLVTIPEETPVNEAVETAFSLEDRVGVSLGPIVVNGVYPDVDALDVDVAAAAGGRRGGARCGRPGGPAAPGGGGGAGGGRRVPQPAPGPAAGADRPAGRPAAA